MCGEWIEWREQATVGRLFSNPDEELSPLTRWWFCGSREADIIEIIKIILRRKDQGNGKCPLVLGVLKSQVT